MYQKGMIDDFRMNEALDENWAQEFFNTMCRDNGLTDRKGRREWCLELKWLVNNDKHVQDFITT